MTIEEATKNLLAFAERTKYMSDGNGLLGSWITTALSSPWISVKDELPKDGQLILYSKQGRETGRRFYETIYYPEPRITDDMDYWMPIEEIKEEKK